MASIAAHPAKAPAVPLKLIVIADTRSVAETFSLFATGFPKQEACLTPLCLCTSRLVSFCQLNEVCREPWTSPFVFMFEEDVSEFPILSAHALQPLGKVLRRIVNPPQS